MSMITLPVMENMTLLKDLNGHAQVAIDTSLLSVSQAISHISSLVEVKDLSVDGQTVEELVVSLYEEFQI